MCRHIPVDPDKWCEMVKALAENDVLKAEIKRLAADTLKDLSLIEELKAEVEHLGAFRTHTIIPNEILQAENARLKAEVERLRKAGDAIESALREMQGDYPRCLANEWLAAKEGRPNE